MPSGERPSNPAQRRSRRRAGSTAVFHRWPALNGGVPPLTRKGDGRPVRAKPAGDSKGRATGQYAGQEARKTQGLQATAPQTRPAAANPGKHPGGISNSGVPLLVDKRRKSAFADFCGRPHTKTTGLPQRIPHSPANPRGPKRPAGQSRTPPTTHQRSPNPTGNYKSRLPNPRCATQSAQAMLNPQVQHRALQPVRTKGGGRKTW